VRVIDGTEALQSACVLVVDDEPIIRDTVALNLRREGINVLQAETGPDALAVMQSSRPDVVVLDIMLPGMDGLEVCRRIREISTVPILLLSARGEEIDRVLGLELGADDYLTKPFAMRELVARVRAMLRRVRMVKEPEGFTVPAETAAPASPDPGSRIVAGDITVDIAARQATLDGEPLSLKPKEFDLLAYFSRHPGTVMTRDALLREVWGYHYQMDTRTVDVHIRWLRQKLEDDPAVPTRILTVRGHGYRFVANNGAV
jgi:DNA-binding response OmpR family regulator